jgi:hypothetical protein
MRESATIASLRTRGSLEPIAESRAGIAFLPKRKSAETAFFRTSALESVSAFFKVGRADM